MHTLFLLARMGAFFLWMGCWCVWLERRLRLPAAAAPLAVVCGSSVALYAAALLNVMAPVQLALYLAGPALALVELRRGAGQALRPFVSVSTALFLAAAGLTLLLERGRVIDEHDALAHWAVAAKSILNNGRLPNMGDLAVEYVDYPPAAELWIKLVCGITGFSDGGMVFAQGLVFLAALLAFAPLCKKRWYAGAAVAGFGLFLACTTTAWRDLRVDGLLTAATAAVWAVTAALRRSPERSLPAAIPALCFLVLLKNSGLFFVLLAGLPLVVLLARRGAGPAWKRAGLAALPLAAPALCWWLWQAHVAQVFVDASASKHAASLSAYGQRLADKTPEDLAAFRQAFAACWTDFSRPAVLRAWLFLGLFAAVCLVLAVAKRLSARAAAGYAAAAVFSGAVYVAALAGIYLFSMSTEEMLALASIERYASSFFDCLPAAALVLALAVRPAPEGRSGLRPAPGDGPLAWGCLAAALFCGAPYPAAARLLRAPVQAVQGRQKQETVNAPLLLEIWQSLLRDALMRRTGGAAARNPDQEKLTERIAARFTTAQIQGIIELLGDGLRRLAFGASGALTVDAVLAGLNGEEQE